MRRNNKGLQLSFVANGHTNKVNSRASWEVELDGGKGVQILLEGWFPVQCTYELQLAPAAAAPTLPNKQIQQYTHPPHNAIIIFWHIVDDDWIKEWESGNPIQLRVLGQIVFIIITPIAGD